MKNAILGEGEGKDSAYLDLPKVKYVVE